MQVEVAALEAQAERVDGDVPIAGIALGQTTGQHQVGFERHDRRDWLIEADLEPAMVSAAVCADVQVGVPGRQREALECPIAGLGGDPQLLPNGALVPRPLRPGGAGRRSGPSGRLSSQHVVPTFESRGGCPSAGRCASPSREMPKLMCTKVGCAVWHHRPNDTVTPRHRRAPFWNQSEVAGSQVERIHSLRGWRRAGGGWPAQSRRWCQVDRLRFAAATENVRWLSGR